MDFILYNFTSNISTLFTNNFFLTNFIPNFLFCGKFYFQPFILLTIFTPIFVLINEKLIEVKFTSFLKIKVNFAKLKS